MRVRPAQRRMHGHKCPMMVWSTKGPSHKGPAHKGQGGVHKGPAQKDPGGPTRATRAYGGPQGLVYICWHIYIYI